MQRKFQRPDAIGQRGPSPWKWGGQEGVFLREHDVGAAQRTDQRHQIKGALTDMPSKKKTLRLGVAGLGTVGGGLLKLVARQDELRLPGRLVVTAVSARNKSRNRGVDISKLRWVDDPVELATADDVDVVVELIGGSDGPAKRTVEAALKAGKAVITANKALIAEHGIEIAELAEANNAHLLFEAAVAGAIPIVRAIRNSLSGVSCSACRAFSTARATIFSQRDAAHGRGLRERARRSAAAWVMPRAIPISTCRGWMRRTRC